MATTDEASKQKECITVGMDFTLECTAQVLKHLSGHEREQKLNEMRDNMLGFAMMEKNYIQSLEVIVCMRGELKNKDFSSDENDKAADFEKIFQSKKKQLQKDNTIDSLREHQKYQSLEQEIRNTLASESELTEGHDDGGSTNNESQDLIFTHFDAQTIDPITKQEMKSPVINQMCGHSYEKHTILQMIKRSKKFKCPYIGCQNRNPLKASDLRDNLELKKIIRQKHRVAGTNQSR